MDIFTAILTAMWDILRDAAPFMIFGFAIAGLMRAFVPADLVARHLGRGGARSVIKAAVLGAPLPLCSCSVLPAAAGLREQGASKGAAASFLIATPETGVDSIAASYALLDPFMTVTRPIAAVTTAVLAGLGIDRFDKEQPNAHTPERGAAAPQQTTTCSCCSCHGAHADHPEPKASVSARAFHGLRHAFSEMLADIGGWFLAGVALAGVITVLLPDNALETWLGGGPWPMLTALVVAVPLYVCATASTPLAAALVLKGLSPGAALVFLLAGPATNAATLTVVAKMLGRRAAVIYVGSIVLTALVMGVLTDAIYRGFGLSTAGWLSGGAQGGLTIVGNSSAVLLLLGIGLAIWGKRRTTAGHCHCPVPHNEG